jgi:7-carboxy-7-deazaguanine synthase
MPPPPILKISEIFASVQGEGTRQGEPTIFVRLAGCNLNCEFCDTRYAWKGGRNLSPGDVLEKIKIIRRNFPAAWVCLTGGEPLLQDVRWLVSQIKKKGLRVQVETNGTLYRPLAADWYTLSPKPEKYFFQPAFRKRAKEVKLIVTRRLEFRTVQKLRKEFPRKTPLLLQPQSNRRWSIERSLKLLEESLSAGLPNVRLSAQLHKIFKFK